MHHCQSAVPDPASTADARQPKNRISNFIGALLAVFVAARARVRGGGGACAPVITGASAHQGLVSALPLPGTSRPDAIGLSLQSVVYKSGRRPV